jgi:ATP-dependent helicase/nuclease subunit A
VSLAGVLRSPFFALADETLFWLVDSAGSLNAGLLAEKLPSQLPAEERGKAADAAATIAHLRAVKDCVPVAALLGMALDRTGYDAVLVGEFLGERKLANLYKLLEHARAADAGFIDLAGFITQLAEFISRPPKEPLASTCPETDDVIRLMTIHRAKGLEFPLVVVPDLDRPPHLIPPAAALDAELGPLVHPPSDDEREPSVTGMSLFAAREKSEELAERARLLYVAVTRAADYLILSSSLEDHAKLKSDWMRLLAGRFDLATGTLAARLPDGYGTPLVRVHAMPTADREATGRSRGRDILKALEEAHEMAAAAQGMVPRAVGPIAVDHAARRQFSVSRLGGHLVPADEQVEPMDASAGAPSPAAITDPLGFGLLVHDVLARIEFDDSGTVAEWCEHLAPLHVVQNVDGATRSASELIERFINSQTGRQLAGAAALHRELDFLLAWPPDRVAGAERERCANEGSGASRTPPQPPADGVYIQGVIDCLYRDGDGRWRLADYKTNDVRPADVPRVASRYAMQMHVYAMAAERALGEPIAELTLHFLRPGVSHVIPWDDAARREAVKIVNEAIAAQWTNCSTNDLELQNQ